MWVRGQLLIGSASRNTVSILRGPFLQAQSMAWTPPRWTSSRGKLTNSPSIKNQHFWRLPWSLPYVAQGWQYTTIYFLFNWWWTFLDDSRCLPESAPGPENWGNKNKSIIRLQVYDRDNKQNSISADEGSKEQTKRGSWKIGSRVRRLSVCPIQRNKNKRMRRMSERVAASFVGEWIHKWVQESDEILHNTQWQAQTIFLVIQYPTQSWPNWWKIM